VAPGAGVVAAVDPKLKEGFGAGAGPEAEAGVPKLNAMLRLVVEKWSLILFENRNVCSVVNGQVLEATVVLEEMIGR
jgi:hypothetical protein